jgi:TM2 domain-containing membrane protein YozV
MAIILLESKSKTTAYLLWFFLGIFGAHKFYLEKTGIGILYLLSGGLLGVGWVIDLFTLGMQVDSYNALHGGSGQQNNIAAASQNITVNVAPNNPMLPLSEPVQSVNKLSAEKQILALSENNAKVYLKQVISQTNLGMDEAENTLKKLVEKGISKEEIDDEGKTYFNFN